ncbi:cobyric acid synthase [Porphyromonas crevioricanis]|uniref:Cobyric acid synthase n=3 Tax=Porphyromonas crevioricanis TaxID=393921 RepID=A0AB34PFS2_9PORP|nr:cobyric acid synthase [Porphyromonas crevioricanis]KGN94038.1 cobalamin biosynthesis protein CobQ [Porphyromonas crevioricanis]
MRPIMLAGTGSDVGKSILATGLCRILRQDGYRPAPFKAQNMALNSYATPEGLEIGRAQAVQAEACGIDCHVDMNPLLLKPNSDHSSQVVLLGKPVGNKNAYEYFRRQGRDELREVVHQAYDRLAARYEPIVLEGAGSIAELNLRDTDLVNMSMACYADAAVLLVADIDRGGVFASVYGSIALLPEEERRLIRAIIINKFRGDRALFDEGKKILEDLTGVPVLGLVPYFHDIHIEEEDSVSLEKKHRQAAEGKINVAVIHLSHISNFTDFDSLERDPRVHLFYTNNPSEIQQADIVILPGSKSTLSDLSDIRNNGVAEAIVRAHKRGSTVLGICGGYQMMGMEVADPLCIEGGASQIPGLGLLPIRTEMEQEKTTRQVTFELQAPLCGKGAAYEIHQGRSLPVASAVHSPLCRLADGSYDGYVANPRCMGTYLHGILDNADFVEILLQPFASREKTHAVDYASYKNEQYDKLATALRSYLDMDLFYRILNRQDL